MTEATRRDECVECMGRGEQCTVCGSCYTDPLGCEECHAPEDKFKPCDYCGGAGYIEVDVKPTTN